MSSTCLGFVFHSSLKPKYQVFFTVNDRFRLSSSHFLKLGPRRLKRFDFDNKGFVQLLQWSKVVQKSILLTKLVSDNVRAGFIFWVSTFHYLPTPPPKPQGRKHHFCKLSVALPSSVERLKKFVLNRRFKLRREPRAAVFCKDLTFQLMPSKILSNVLNMQGKLSFITSFSTVRMYLDLQ